MENNENNDLKPYETDETVRRLKCLRCEHMWTPRKLAEPKPLTCPACHSSYWFRPRIRPQKPKVDKPTNE
ncbi:MAG TPA: hypothetical protein VKR58_09520 [Aquella sp.]|nr:hypothetical protein [Aquella sp.]